MYHADVKERVLAYIREHELLKPGDRVGVAVSGGADSVALLRVLLELRVELGTVLSVLHFNHKIRSADADEDERFVSELAKQQGLDFHCSSADVPAYAAEHRLSLETAGREARYQFFRSFFQRQALDVVATGHTMDDQAETVLMRVLRGAGTKGLAGIFPSKPVEDCRSACGGRIVRPLLAVRRAEARTYLQVMDQSWREDATNLDLQYTRNRIRHGLIPLIETRFQPTAVAALAQLAEVAREEENYWSERAEEHLTVVMGGEVGHPALNLPAFLVEPVAMQRRLLRTLAGRVGLSLDFAHIEQVRRLAGAQVSAGCCELPRGWVAVRQQQELRFELRRNADQQATLGYEYRLSVPGEVEIREIGRVVRAFLRPVQPGAPGYNPEESLDPATLGTELVVRNWQPGDRLWPARAKGPKKLKELLQERRVPSAQRKSWPVAASGGKLAWSRGFGASAEFRPAGGSKQVVVIEEHVLHPGRER